MSQPIDQVARTRAIDPSQSFIVQAPAGSGKTELLSQRYLTLLTTVQQPEEVLALTFTKKAAAEMRERILHALNEAKRPYEGSSDHERHRYDLACRVLAHDEAHDWQLCKNPNRMKIQTLDSLAAKISRTRPILTEGQSNFRIEDNPKQYYQLAARNVIEYLHDTELEWQKAVYNIIQHLDVNLFKIENLFMNILSRREQWLPYLLERDLDEQIKRAISASQQQILNKLKQVDAELLAQWIEVGLFTDRQLERSRIVGLDDPSTAFDSKHIDAWKAMLEVVLKKDLDFRKKLDKNCGFPAPSTTKDKHEKEERKIYKEKALEVIAQLRESSGLLEVLKEIAVIPRIDDYEAIAPLMNSLQELLPILTAELKHIFNSEHIIDFNELTSLAQATLMDHDQPSDIQLKLDYQIKHILVDEFQDTSINQYQLLQSLTAGWEQGDGRTLFFVGDPMQSIYRFRQAEVGLFLKVQSGSFGRLSVEPLYLQSNFRSSKDVIHWVNDAFKHIFPTEAIAHLGAVNYSDSVAERNFEGRVHAMLYQSNEQEAESLCQLIREKNEQGKKVAILVRSRNHLIALSHTLKQHRLQYNATELDRMLDDQLCLDLLSMTQALCDSNHKLAWLALLRSPCCGLSLDSLYALSQADDNDFLAHLNAQAESQALAVEEQTRLQIFLEIMNAASALVKKVPLAELVNTVWHSFLHEKIYPDHEKKRRIAHRFFDVLEQHEENFYISDFHGLYDDLARIRVDESHGSQCLIEIMTIHKSKGLEFDVVVLPQLHRLPSHGDQQILIWSEFADDSGAPHFMLAPIKNGKQDEPLHDYLKYLNKSREHYELQRLLYVACTRAKTELYLSGIVQRDDEHQIKEPSASTLLGLVWPHLEFEQCFDASEQEGEEENIEPMLKRIPLEHYQQLSNTHFDKYADLLQPLEAIDKPFSDWRTQTGTLIHYVFSEALLRDDFELSETLLNHLLFTHQIGERDSEQAKQLIERAVHNLKQGEHSRWLLSPHQDKHTEFELTVTDDEGERHKQYIDLLFVDEDDTRWIIDHKIITSDRVSEQKLRQQYAPQLEAYRESMSALESRPCRIALYLPVQDQLLEL